MKSNLFRLSVLGLALSVSVLSSCKKDDGAKGKIEPSGPDNMERQYITLTGAFPDASGSAGNGGTRAFAVTLAQAEDPTYVVNVFNNGYILRSQRTARVQGSVNGNFLYNIQYTGDDGGIFNKYKVNAGDNFIDTREEVNTEPLLGNSPRWVVAGNEVGIGVYGASLVSGSKEGAGADFVSVRSTAKIAVLDLSSPVMKYVKQEFEIPFTTEQKADGYHIGRIDVPVLNANKTKVFIGCSVSHVDISKVSGVNASGAQTWSTKSNALGTATLVLDYPSLSNPKLIFSGRSTDNNNSYRTMTQYVGTDGYIYQATATSGSQILRINGNTGEYDNTFDFNLKTALSSSTDVAIKAWRYVKDGIGLVLYTQTGVNGGYIALINLNDGTATKLTTEKETDAGFSGLTAANNNGVALTGSFGQFQNIAVHGDDIYVPLTPNGIDGNLYIINYLTKAVKKGAILKNQSGSFYLGAY